MMSEQSSFHPEIHGHKVHFPEDGDKFSDTSAITVQQLDANKYAVHLGFLKLQHRYEVRFGVARLLSDIIQNPPHLFARLVEVVPSPVDTELKIEFFAHKEKLLKEVIVVEDVNTNEAITFVLNARVLGKGKGTPSLKTGIRCIGCEVEDESEASDWQGFV